MNYSPPFIRLAYWVASLLVALVPLRLAAQFKYEVLNNTHGLSQGYVFDILQDREGFLWFTTKDGLNRYDGYQFKVFSHDAYDSTSISDNSCISLFEDRYGRIWIGTEANGISVYDKETDRFFRIGQKEGVAHSLSGNRIQYPFIEMRDGRIMTCTHRNKINLITLPPNAHKQKVEIKIEELEIPFDYYNLVFYTDHNGETWLNAQGKHMKFNPAINDFEWIKDTDQFCAFQQEANGITWTNSIYYSLLEAGQSYALFDKPVLENQGNHLYVDEKQRLWATCANLNLLNIYDISQWQKGRPIDPMAHLLAADKIGGLKMFRDRSGILWMATNGYGLRKYMFESEKFNHQAKGFSARRIMQTLNQGIYLRGWAESKLLQSDGQMLPDNIAPVDQMVHDVYIAKNGDYWIIEFKGNSKAHYVHQIERVNPITRKRIKYPITFPIIYGYIGPTLEDKNGYLWFCGTGGHFVVLNPETGTLKYFKTPPSPSNPKLAGTYFTSIYEDAKGVVWIGTEIGMIEVKSSDMLKTNPVYKWYESKPKDKNSLNHNHISCFLDDPADPQYMWICTKGGGLNLFHKPTGNFTHLTTQQGLCNNVVYGIMDDEKGNIWGSTNNGLFCILANGDKLKKNWDIRHFTQAGGLQSNEFNTNAFTKLRNGDFVFGGVNGINIFNPQKILIDTFKPNIFITQLMVDNQAIRSGDASGILDRAIEFAPSITLSHRQNVFTLEFSSLDFRASDQNKYRYRLEGVDEQWVDIGTRRVVTFSHLPAGDYVFRVQGTNSLGIWSGKEATLKITVLPPWWNTWWAYLIYLTIAAFGLRVYFAYRLRQGKMEAQLLFEQNEARRIKELDTVKTQLYNNITHEFRTPLTVILGMVQQIRSSTSQYLDAGLDMIERNGKNLLNLVNEMLDLSKLEAGKMELHTETGDVVNFIRYIVESFHSFAETKGVKFHYLSSLDSYYTRFDTEKLRQILSNLFSNALKFSSDNGDVYISISLEKGDKNLLFIKVKDTGSGIPEHQLSSIFDRFYQADSSHTRKAEGTGIGLALTKELVQLMNGIITVQSPPVGAKKGSEFAVCLPLDPAIEIEISDKEKYTTEESAGQPNPSTTKITHIDFQHKNAELILLVEDNADVVAYTASCLPDYRLAVAKDGQEGLEIATEIVPDLIITDVMMPFMDGFEMCQRLRKDEKTSHIPIIMLTAKADQESKMEGLEYGAEVYLEKPFYKEELLLRIRKLLDQRKILQRVYSKVAGLNQIAQEPEMPAQEVESTVAFSVIEDQFVVKVREEIEKNLQEEAYSVDQMCKHLFMSYSQLHRKLSALLDLSPNQYIKMLRLKKACELLSQTNSTVASIANQCGFGDAGYFGKVFKQEFGMTPQEWRNKV